jgi:hypothetical protein
MSLSNLIINGQEKPQKNTAKNLHSCSRKCLESYRDIDNIASYGIQIRIFPYIGMRATAVKRHTCTWVMSKRPRCSLHLNENEPHTVHPYLLEGSWFVRCVPPLICLTYIREGDNSIKATNQNTEFTL